MGLKKQIIQFKDGKQIAIYKSAIEAAKVLGVSEDRIYKHLSKKTKKDINGFTFEYTGEYTNKVEHSGDYKCPYCDERFETYNGLCKHILKYKAHGTEITKEQLLTDFKYGGVRPTCKCGCGGYTNIRYDGGAHFQEYIVGHHNRIHNNWGHNEKAKLHSAETRRKQYASGERIQWNKDKKWVETYDEEEIKRLTKIHRDKIYRMLNETEFSLSSKVEKEFIETCIKPLNIEFNTQHYIKDINHYCDVYIPSKNTIIEFQGDYWHGNPKKYLKEELSKFQLEKVEKDEVLRKYCSDNGINLIEIWESDYNKDVNSVKKLLNDLTN